MRRWVKYLVIGVGVALLLPCLGITLPVEVPFYLVAGWAYYLARVVPQVSVNWLAVGVTIGAVVVFADGLHLFLRWLYRHIPIQQATEGTVARWRVRWTAALVGTVVLMFAAGIAFTGIVHQLGWMASSRDRWLETDGIRAAARRAQSTVNLKQMGLGLYLYQQAYDTFPNGATADRHGELLHSWQTSILPYVDQATLFNQIDRNRPWDDPQNAPAFKTKVWCYLNPGLRDFERDTEHYALTHYAGNARVLGGLRSRRIEDFKDGTANTIMAGEIPQGFPPWGRPGNWRDLAKGINQAPDGFGGPYHGGANFLMSDGTVRFLKNTIDPGILRALSTPGGGETVPGDF